MKKIVTVKRHNDGHIRIYEVAEDIAAGETVIFRFGSQITSGVATQNSIEVEDDIVAYFTDKPLVMAARVPQAMLVEEDDGNDA